MSASILPFEAPKEPARGAAQRGDGALQRAAGEARIVFTAADGALRVSDLYQKSPGRILIPRVDGRSGAEAVFLNTSGGVAGGDVMRYGVAARDGARVLATTQAAEKVYRAIDRDALLHNDIVAAGGASLEWLPQPAILFDGARLQRRTEIAVEGDARVLAFDSLVLGRAAHGETLRRGEVRDDWRLIRDGRLVWADSFRLGGDIAGLAARGALLGGRRVVATLIYAGPDAESVLEPAREMLARTELLARAGIVAGVMVARFLAERTDELMAGVTRFLTELRGLIGGAGHFPPCMWRC